LKKSIEMSENAVHQLGRMDTSEGLGTELHAAARIGRKRRLKKILAKGITFVR
jgi:hypothetical protein